MKRGPIQEDTDLSSERVLKTEVDEKENSMPPVKDPTVGSRSQEGMFDSLDFWTSGRDMMLSRLFTTRKSCEQAN